jgi:ArsR family transcriptional regulator
VNLLKAAAEPTRLRILMLLRAGELSVKDLTRILGQSQPRISRHLRLMVEAGLIERHRDGSWAYYQFPSHGSEEQLLRRLLECVDFSDPALVRDAGRAETVKREREAAAQDYFRVHAAEWDRIRAMHVTEAAVEAEVAAAVGEGPFGLLVDLGTGTGRMLELLAGRYARAIGFDINHSMLAYARSKLARAGLTGATVRHGDLYGVALPDGAADAVIMHQVLHFLAEPVHSVREAVRLLAPGGKLVIVDFAPHELEFLRDQHAHERLGFATAQVGDWLTSAGLANVKTRSLPPPAAAEGDKLTVSIWTAERARASNRSVAQPDTTESRVEA